MSWMLKGSLHSTPRLVRSQTTTPEFSQSRAPSELCRSIEAIPILVGIVLLVSDIWEFFSDLNSTFGVKKYKKGWVNIVYELKKSSF